ncbi:MAG: hypothetical protein HUU06_12935 [Planctomycetaceae bacterium]|nr:hypothetical protein [Planctomycetota bacterium]NUN53672.1 hypothetical protein [Planctomycetaceae bacterium]
MRERLFRLERTGGRRRSVVEAGGAELCTCVYLGPGEGGVDLVAGRGPPAATVRGGRMEVRDFLVTLSGGEGIRVLGEPPLLDVLSDRRARTRVAVAEEAGGRRSFTWERDGWIAAVLRTVPSAGAEPWVLEVPGWEDPIRGLAVLHAAERLLRERETPLPDLP